MRQQVTGQVRLAVVAAAIQPPLPRTADASGKQTSNLASLIPLAGKALRIGAVGGAALGMLLDFFTSSSSSENEVPSARIEVLFNGNPKPWVQAAVVRRNYLPTWPRVVSPQPQTFGARTNVVIAAYDGSGSDFPIGNCTISGVPAVDGNNYIVEDSMVCNGRLLAAKVQLQPVFLLSAAAQKAYGAMFHMRAAYRHWKTAQENVAGCPKKLALLTRTKKDPIDPWGHDYLYECPLSDPMTIQITSRGPDGKADTADDLHLSDDLSGAEDLTDLVLAE
jgi:hypothetical protein